MEPRIKATRLSTALELDMTPVVEEVTRAVLGSVNQVVAEQTMPALVEILEAIKQARVVLDPVEAQHALDKAIPRGYLYHGSGEAVSPVELANLIHVELARAGYGLVPIGPQAVDTRLTFERVRDNEVVVRSATGAAVEIGTPNLAPGERVPAHGLEYRPDLLERDKIRQQGTGQQDDLDGWASDLRG